MGWLSLKGEEELIPIMTRFNILTSAVELKCRKQIRRLQTNTVEMVMLGTRLFIPSVSSPTNYFEILSHGQINLLGAYKLGVIYDGDTLYSSTVNGDKKNTAKVVYYYSKDGQVAVPLKNRKINILKLMGNREMQNNL